MDLFVVNQLTLCNCQKYITLFKDHGYDEVKYRNLRLSTLVKLMPEEDDEESVDRICENIVNLRSSGAINYSTPAPGETVVVKVEPNGDDADDDEVQIIHVVNQCAERIIGCPPVKLECSDEIEADAGDLEGQGVIVKIEGRIDYQDHDNVFLPSEAEIEVQEGNIAVEEDSSAVTPINSSIDKDMVDAVCVDNGSNKRMKLRKRRTPMVEAPDCLLCGFTSVEKQKTPKHAKKSKSITSTSSNSCSSSISLTYQRSNVTHSLSGVNLSTVVGIDNKHSKLQLRFEFTKLHQLASFLEELLIHSSSLKNVQKLKLVGLSKDIYVGQSELTQLLCIEPLFFGKLKFLVLGFGFTDEIDPRCITQLLSLCSNLEILKVKRGIFGQYKIPNSLISISIQIPEMPKLTIFHWEKMVGVTQFEFPAAPIEVNLEEDSEDESAGQQTSFRHPLAFELNFCNNQLINLKELTVGRHALISFQHFNQFPALIVFTVPSPWIKFNLTEVGISTSINSVELPDGICDLNIIKQIPICFPNLSALGIILPSVAALRSCIHVLSSTSSKLKELYIAVDYEFDDALTTALLDIPYNKLTSMKDLKKLAGLKRYKYWEELSKYIGIQLPEVAEEDGYLENMADSEEGSRRHGLGSLKCLEKLRIMFWEKLIYLPKNDYHWRDPKVEYFNRGWSRSSRKHIFPLRPLVNESNKLKPHFKQLELWYFEVIRKIPWDCRRFKMLTGITPEITQIGRCESSDCFSTQNLTTLVKQEKLKE